MVEVKIKLLTDTAKIPTKAHDTDACFDIYADIPDATYEYTEEIKNPFGGFYGGKITKTGKGRLIPPHETILIPTGFATDIPVGYSAKIYARSGMASKKKLRPAQGVPVIDSDYRGQWYVPLHNDGDSPQIVEHGDRIVQFDIQEVIPTVFVQVNELNDTERGTGGFSSTGIK